MLCCSERHVFCLHMHKCGSFCAGTVDEKPDKGLLKDEQKKQVSTRPFEGALHSNSRTLVSSSAFQGGQKPRQLATCCTILFMYRLAHLNTCISMLCRSSDEGERNITTFDQPTCGCGIVQRYSLASAFRKHASYAVQQLSWPCN